MTTGDKKRVVLVTGASRGLGKAIALRFGNTDHKVVVHYQERARAAADVVERIRAAGGEAVPVRADVRITAEVDAMVADTIKRWGRIDVLVNNAGMTRDGLMLRMSQTEWDDVLGTNLTGPFHCIRAVAGVMIRMHDGQIISIASIVGLQGREGQTNYSASKAGLIGLTRACAKEFGPFNIKVNAVLPGYLPTDMGGELSKEMLDRIVQSNALGRVSNPVEVADFVHHLSLMQDVSGQVFNLDSRAL
ncbi:MAG TPA: 3-oxoacyl-ACP reductase FabG [Nitrospirota bacterium]|nr:3-oxoacyl-ACP reductase FabG [Nitrospirota bacterium]